MDAYFLDLMCANCLLVFGGVEPRKINPTWEGEEAHHIGLKRRDGREKTCLLWGGCGWFPSLFGCAPWTAGAGWPRPN